MATTEPPLRPLHSLPPEAVQTCRLQHPVAYEALIQYDSLYLNSLARLEAKEAELARCIEVGQEVLVQLNTMRQKCSELGEEKEVLQGEVRSHEQLVVHLKDKIRARDLQIQEMATQTKRGAKEEEQEGTHQILNNGRSSTSRSASPALDGGASSSANTNTGLQARVTSLRSELDRAVERILELENTLEREVRAKQSAERHVRTQQEEVERLGKELEREEDQLGALKQQVAVFSSNKTQEDLDICSCGVILANLLQSSTTPQTAGELRAALTRHFSEHQQEQTNSARVSTELQNVQEQFQALQVSHRTLQKQFKSQQQLATSGGGRSSSRSVSPRTGGVISGASSVKSSHTAARKSGATSPPHQEDLQQITVANESLQQKLNDAERENHMLKQEILSLRGAKAGGSLSPSTTDRQQPSASGLDNKQQRHSIVAFEDDAASHSSPQPRKVGDGGGRGQPSYTELEAKLLDAEHRIAMLEVTNQQLREEGMRVAAPAPVTFNNNGPLSPNNHKGSSRARGKSGSRGGAAGGGDANMEDIMHLINSQRDEILEVQSVVQTLTDRLSERESEIDRLVSQKETLEVELKRSHEVHEGRGEEMQRELRNLNVENETLRQSLKTLRNEASALQEVAATVAEHNDEVEKHRALKSHLETTIAKREEHIAELTRDVSNLQAQFTAYKEVHKTPTAKVTALQSELDDRVQELEHLRNEFREGESVHAATKQQQQSAINELVDMLRHYTRAVRAAVSQIAVVDEECDAVEYTSLVRVVRSMMASIKEPLVGVQSSQTISASLSHFNVPHNESFGVDGAIGDGAGVNQSTTSTAATLSIGGHLPAASAGPTPSSSPSTVAKKKSYMKSLLSQLQETETTVAAESAKCRDLHNELLTTKSNSEDHEREILQLKRNIEKCLEDVRIANEETAKWRGEVTSMRSKLHEADQLKHEAEMELKRSAASVERLEKKVSTVQEELETQSQELHKRADCIRELQGQNRDLAHKVQRMDSEETEKLAKTSAAQSAELRSLRNEYDKVVERLDAAEGAASEFEEQCQQLQQRNNTLVEKLTMAREELINTQQVVQEMESDDSSGKVRDDELQRAQQTINMLQENLNQVHNVSGELEVNKNALNSEILALKRQIAEMQGKNTDLESAQLNVDSLRQKIEFLKTENDQLNIAATADAKAIEALQRTNTTLEERVLHIERDRDSLRSVLQQTGAAAVGYRSGSVESSRILT